MIINHTKQKPSSIEDGIVDPPGLEPAPIAIGDLIMNHNVALKLQSFLGIFSNSQCICCFSST